MKKKILNGLREVWKIPILEKILVHQTKGNFFGSLITKLPPNHYQYSKNTIRKVKRDGINYQLNLSDIVDWFIYFGFKELSRQNLYDLTNENDCVIDIGANIGDVTMHCSEKVGKGGEIHSFEPDPVNFERLKTNLHLNNFSNITINKFGLGFEIGNCYIANVDSHNQGMNRIVNPTSNTNNLSQVQMTTLDIYIKEKGLEKVDLIKIDVEGFEFNVLKGSKEVLDSYHPTLFIELDDENLIEQGSSAKELLEFLEVRNYEISHAETGEKMTKEAIFDKCHYDIIARHIS